MAAISLSGAMTGFLLIVPSLVNMSVFHHYLTVIVCGISYFCGPSIARPIIKAFHKFTVYCLVMWMKLTVIAVELVSGTCVALTYVDRRKNITSVHPATGGPDLQKLIEPPRPGKVKIIIMNHHCRVDWLYIYLFIARTSLGNRLRVVLKDDLRKVPFFGVSMQIFAYIFLSRSWTNDAPYIARMVDTLKWIESSSVVQIYPEGTDLSKSNIEKSQAFAAKNNLPQFMYVLNPRTTGLVAIKDMFGDDRVESIIDLTIGYTYSKPGLRPNEPCLVNGRHPRKVHFLIQEYPMKTSSSTESWAVPSQDDAFSAWIHGQFALKEQLLSRFYQTSPVGFDTPDVKAVLGQEVNLISYDSEEQLAKGDSRWKVYVDNLGMMSGVILPVFQWIILPLIIFSCQCHFLCIRWPYMALLNFITLLTVQFFSTRVNIQKILYFPSVGDISSAPKEKSD